VGERPQRADGDDRVHRFADGQGQADRHLLAPDCFRPLEPENRVSSKELAENIEIRMVLFANLLNFPS